MFVEIPANKESMSISFKKMLLELIDFSVDISAYNGRSGFVGKACHKQLIFQTKLGDLLELLKIAGKEIEPSEKEEITITVPSGFLRLLEKHCLNYSCDMTTQFFFIAGLKYLMMKEDPHDFFENLYEKMDKNEKAFFKAILT